MAMADRDTDRDARPLPVPQPSQIVAWRENVGWIARARLTRETLADVDGGNAGPHPDEMNWWSAFCSAPKLRVMSTTLAESLLEGLADALDETGSPLNEASRRAGPPSAPQQSFLQPTASDPNQRHTSEKLRQHSNVQILYDSGFTLAVATFLHAIYIASSNHNILEASVGFLQAMSIPTSTGSPPALTTTPRTTTTTNSLPDSPPSPIKSSNIRQLTTTGDSIRSTAGEYKLIAQAELQGAVWSVAASRFVQLYLETTTTTASVSKIEVAVERLQHEKLYDPTKSELVLEGYASSTYTTWFVKMANTVLSVPKERILVPNQAESPPDPSHSHRAWVVTGDSFLADDVNKTKIRPDFALFASTPGSWSNILVVGEHHSKGTSSASACSQLASYASQVFAAQPFRIFVYGIYTSNKSPWLTIWRFDRSGALESTRFSFQGPKNVRLVVGSILSLGTLPLRDLGFQTEFLAGDRLFWRINPAYKNEDFWITVEPTYQAGLVRLRLAALLERRRGIVCRATTCWVAESETGEKYVVKFSWQALGHDSEASLYMKAKEAEVVGLATLFAAKRTLRVLHDVRRGLTSAEVSASASLNPHQGSTSSRSESGKSRAEIIHSTSTSKVNEHVAMLSKLRSGSRSTSSPGVGANSSTPATSESAESRPEIQYDRVAMRSKLRSGPRSNHNPGLVANPGISATSESGESIAEIESLAPLDKVKEDLDLAYNRHDRIFTMLTLSPHGTVLGQGNLTHLEMAQAILAGFIGHGSLYFHARILHRDISVWNIVHSVTPIPVPSTRRSFLGHDITELHGFLIDLDVAMHHRPTTTGRNPTTKPKRSGTIPFMAIQILEQTSFHMYHHDLESFFYVLLYCSAATPDRRLDIYKHWARSAHLALEKRKLITELGALEIFLARIGASKAWMGAAMKMREILWGVTLEDGRERFILDKRLGEQAREEEWKMFGEIREVLAMLVREVVREDASGAMEGLLNRMTLE